MADRMLLLAPVIEPPPGFESKVLARMGVAPAVRAVVFDPSTPAVRVLLLVNGKPYGSSPKTVSYSAI